ncbi:hypothetical protein G7Y89_g9418 [Cudoniella acicularis]|uniref:Uncharacterized protein n=1 Tax=Cudoniella acicularis TaxID=354080 RepID=A0A8H4REQ6_9HELO|nr:hypothetical protein G7Y89_g9418 [Cudoniella acicularis]
MAVYAELNGPAISVGDDIWRPQTISRKPLTWRFAVREWATPPVRLIAAKDCSTGEIHPGSGPELRKIWLTMLQLRDTGSLHVAMNAGKGPAASLRLSTADLLSISAITHPPLLRLPFGAWGRCWGCAQARALRPLPYYRDMIILRSASELNGLESRKSGVCGQNAATKPLVQQGFESDSWTGVVTRNYVAKTISTSLLFDSREIPSFWTSSTGQWTFSKGEMTRYERVD